MRDRSMPDQRAISATLAGPKAARYRVISRARPTLGAGSSCPSHAVADACVGRRPNDQTTGAGSVDERGMPAQRPPGVVGDLRTRDRPEKGAHLGVRTRFRGVRERLPPPGVDPRVTGLPARIAAVAATKGRFEGGPEVEVVAGAHDVQGDAEERRLDDPVVGECPVQAFGAKSADAAPEREIRERVAPAPGVGHPFHGVDRVDRMALKEQLAGQRRPVQLPERQGRVHPGAATRRRVHVARRPLARLGTVRARRSPGRAIGRPCGAGPDPSGPFDPNHGPGVGRWPLREGRPDWIARFPIDVPDPPDGCLGIEPGGTWDARSPPRPGRPLPWPGRPPAAGRLPTGRSKTGRGPRSPGRRAGAKPPAIGLPCGRPRPPVDPARAGGPPRPPPTPTRPTGTPPAERSGSAPAGSSGRARSPRRSPAGSGCRSRRSMSRSSGSSSTQTSEIASPSMPARPCGRCGGRSPRAPSAARS